MGETRKVVGIPDAPRGRAAGRLAARFALNERGATAIEYGLMAALIAVVIITALLAVSGSVKANLYTAIEAAVTAMGNG